MGECGCGELSPHKVLKVGNKIIVLEVYKGCEYCNTGLMVTLHVFTLKEAAAFSLIEQAKLFSPGEDEHAQIDIPLVGKEDLVIAAHEIGETIGPDGYDSLDDYLADNGLLLIQHGVRHRMQETAQQRT